MNKIVPKIAGNIIKKYVDGKHNKKKICDG
jgi:hypothetical protein